MDARSRKVDERPRGDEPNSGARRQVPGVRCEALVLVRGGNERQPALPLWQLVGNRERRSLHAVYCPPSPAHRLLPAIPGQATFPRATASKETGHRVTTTCLSFHTPPHHRDIPFLYKL